MPLKVTIRFKLQHLHQKPLLQLAFCLNPESHHFLPNASSRLFLQIQLSGFLFTPPAVDSQKAVV